MPAPKPINYLQKAPENIQTGLARSAGHGLLFGFGDEVESFVRSLSQDEDYSTALQQVRS